MMNEVPKAVNVLVSLAVLGLIVLILFGNLSGNVGFATDTQGYNDTQKVIGNVTGGTVSLFSIYGTVFKILGVLLLFGVVFLIWSAFKGGFGSENKDKFAN
ncbi:MAG: hypothetical protein WC711_04035 [Candidatus Staskawiczbacteria bacterium]